MAKLEITLSLSRAHKIAERLKAKATELTSEAERLARSVGLSGKTAGKSQTERLASQVAEANAGRFALELDDDMAAEVTGA